MAAILGVELKGLKRGNGHDTNSSFSASIYICSRKVGTVSNDGWGASNDYEFFSEESEKMFDEKIEEYFKKFPSFLDSNDIFIYELKNLIQKEKEFKKAIKKGYMAYVHLSDPFDETDMNRVRLQPESYFVVSEEEIDEILSSSKHPKKNVYRDLKDFII